MKAIPLTFLEKKLAVKASDEFRREHKLIKHSHTFHELQFSGHSVGFNPQETIRVRSYAPKK